MQALEMPRSRAKSVQLSLERMEGLHYSFFKDEAALTGLLLVSPLASASPSNISLPKVKIMYVGKTSQHPLGNSMVSTVSLLATIDIPGHDILRY